MANASTERRSRTAADWRVVIGLEVHTQLLTRSKMFSDCPADYAGAAANTVVDPVSLGLPGTLPVVNAEALRYGIMAALALNCRVPEWTWFERKNYPYPDLPKGFQLTQYAEPIGHDGYLDVRADDTTRRVRVRRVHLEEDTGKIVHVNDRRGGHSLVDFNRAGVPLMEIVTEPDCRSPEEAVAYLRTLRDILIFLGIASGKLEEGAMRLEANVSVRTAEEAEQGVLRKRCEIKNLNSFEAVRAALAYEVKRQIAVYERGDSVRQATMGWDLARGVTVVQRSKEEAQDYRYFPEPDLPPLHLPAEDVEAIRQGLPELRHQIVDRFERGHGLDTYRAELLAQSRSFAGYFERALAVHPVVDRVANLLLGDFMAQVNERELNVDDADALPVGAEALGEVARQWDAGELTGPQVKQLLPWLFEHQARDPAAVATGKDALGLKTVGGEDELNQVIDQLLASDDPKVQDAVAKLRGGEQKVLGFLVGQVMKATRGQAKPDVAGRLIQERMGD